MDTNYHDYCIEFNKRAYKLFEEWSKKTHGKMSQPKVVEFTGIPQATISKIKTSYENPKEKQFQPPAETICKIAKAFNVTTDYLLGLDDVATTNRATKELCATLGLSENVVAYLKNDFSSYHGQQLAERNNGNDLSFTKLDVEATRQIIDFLIKDHISYMQNENERYNNNTYSLIFLLRRFLRCAEIHGQIHLYEREGEGRTTMDIGNDLWVRREVNDKNMTKVYADLINIKELMITSAIQEIVGYLTYLKNESVKGK